MVACERVAVIIPALNESFTIVAVVKEAINLGCDVYVVDDNSSDSTSELARGAGATVLRMPYTAGAWMAIQAGLLYAVRTKKDYDYFVSVDADGQHSPAYIRQLIAACKATGANVLIGSYPQRGSVARRFAWRIFTALTGLEINDMTSGFRLYDRSAAGFLLSHEAALLDYQDVGVLLLLRRSEMKCLEVPVLMHDRFNGHSRIFETWFEVGRYMGKTLIWIMADWVAGSKRRDWKEYDVF